MYKMLLALAVVAVMACGAVAGEVSQAALSDMNLAGMQSMSDDEGTAVRGAFAIVGGLSFARTPGAGSFNGFIAGDFGPGPDFAIGGSVSASRTTIRTLVLLPNETFIGSVTTITAIAGGGAVAFAGR